MPELVIHPQTKQQLDVYASATPHALLIVGPAGIGKAALATDLAERVLGLKSGRLASYPHSKHISSSDGKAIGIEAVRELEHFLSLKIPGKKEIARLVVIEDAHLLTLEAQNALLKQLEEPPADTVILLTVAHEQALLPTIRSRAQSLSVKKPNQTDLAAYFNDAANDSVVRQALAISGGLPGLTAAILGNNSAHPLMDAVATARHLLQATSYERLLRVDELAKNKEAARNVCYVLMQMAHTALASGSTSLRWQKVLESAYKAQEQLLANGQPKLVLDNLMLSL